jgi:hypothetical protein
MLWRPNQEVWNGRKRQVIAYIRKVTTAYKTLWPQNPRNLERDRKEREKWITRTGCEDVDCIQLVIIGSSGGICEHGDELVGSIRCRKFPGTQNGLGCSRSCIAEFVGRSDTWSCLPGLKIRVQIHSLPTHFNSLTKRHGEMVTISAWYSKIPGLNTSPAICAPDWSVSY